MSGFQLKLWSHHLLQLKNTHTDCFSNSHHPNQNMWHHSFYRCKNAISLFHTRYWITSLIRRKLWVWEAGLETGVQYVKVTVCWFVIKMSFFFFRHGTLLYVFLYMVIFCLFLSILVLLPYCLFYLAFDLPQMSFPKKMLTRSFLFLFILSLCLSSSTLLISFS